MIYIEKGISKINLSYHKYQLSLDFIYKKKKKRKKYDLNYA